MITAVVQARMSSTRLPGKTLVDVCGRPMLSLVLDRLSRSRRVERIVVATSKYINDDPIAVFCSARGIACFRGSLEDVLDRFYRAALESGATVVARITADCPLVDPAIVDIVIDRFLAGDFDYVSNVDPPTFPDGFDVEVFSMVALEIAWRESVKPSDRIHVTTFIRENQDANRFRKANVSNPEDWSSLRFTVDEPADLELVRRAMVNFGHDRFSMAEAVQWILEHPEMRALNQMFGRHEGYRRDLLVEAARGVHDGKYE